jgi:RHS repeat-associated protein
MKKENLSHGRNYNEKTTNSKQEPDGSAAKPDATLSLPKGGGSIRSIDQKFTVNAANGTSGNALALPFSPSRNDFVPALSLGYNSGGGNGPFGLGWSAEPAAITRKTDRQLPQYNDSGDSDTFLFSGAEDLVPMLVKDQSGNWVKQSITLDNITSTQYRPRIEGGFSRIEKISETSGSTYWKVTSGSNIVSIYGKSRSARLADPTDPSRIFQWLLEFSYDDKGNCYQYEYKQEDKKKMPETVHEKNRLNGNSAFTNIYLKRIKYGNKSHLNIQAVDMENWEAFLAAQEYLLEMIFDYGEHDLAAPSPSEVKDWDYRSDAFSEYRAGFEVRTCRLCSRVLMFHRFKELGAGPCLVSSLEIIYTAGTTFTFLTAATQKGHIRKSDGTYTHKSLPSLEFIYEQAGWDITIKTLPGDSMENLPIGIDDNYRWMDLYQEGIPGIFTEQAGGWYYKANAGDGKFDGMQLVAAKPSLSGLSAGTTYFQDIEADGRQFLVSRDLNGYYELSDDEEWLPFRNFALVPNVDLSDPNVKMMDLNGDGRADLLFSDVNGLSWFPSLGKEGFDSRQSSFSTTDEEKGPLTIFDSATESIVLADMSGDGLTDIVRIRNGEVVYWPNLGYGKFGAKVTMGNAPVFDTPEDFNPRYIKLADLDGSGTTDIIYLGRNSFKAHFNQVGNSWSGEHPFDGINPLPFLNINEHNVVSVIDILGNGTACIVWSSPLPQHVSNPLYYIDLMGGKKPYLMTGYRNGMGAETHIRYRPSTYYYLQDKMAGTPWITKLPFPVQCVSQVTTVDLVARTRLTSQYGYHHGYYDHAEREFRGFGRVDQTDTEDFENYKKHAAADGTIQMVDEGFHQPPVLTKTWFHTGAFLNKDKILKHFAHEYYQSNAVTEKALKDSPLPAGLTTEEWRQALRACKGSPLRIEVFTPDGSDQQSIPYTSTDTSCLITLVQPKLQNRHAVFMVQQSESLVYEWERNPADPRIAHSITLETDVFGNVLKSASIGYGRKLTDPDLTPDEQDEQSKCHIVVSENNFTNEIDTLMSYHLPVSYETTSWELTGVLPANDYFSAAEIKTAIANATVIAFENPASPGRLEKRILAQSKAQFLKNDMSGELEFGLIESLVLPYQSYNLALTKSLRDNIFGDKITDAVLLGEAKFVHLNDNNYWIANGTQTLDAKNFYQQITKTDAFGLKTQVSYDTAYRFFVEKITDAMDNTNIVIGFNYRTLSPYLLQDLNDNRAGVRTDELGLVTASFLMGKAGEERGDHMDVTFIEASPNDVPGTIMEYDLLNFKNTGKPNFAKTTVRESHHFDGHADEIPVTSRVNYTYLTGNGTVIMEKMQAEPGLALIENEDGTITEVDTTPALRWRGNGRTILNNKGKPVKEYEPYFSTTPDFEDSSALVERGITPIISYDSAGRMIRTDLPDGTFTKITFDAWKQVSFDQNDTVLESQWYKDRITSPVAAIATPEEKSAANKAAVHAGTAAIAYLNSNGKPFLSVADNGADGKYKTLSRTDISGNIRSITDARGNTTIRFKQNMLGTLHYRQSADSGEQWTLADVLGKPLKIYDCFGRLFSYEYDKLHRPVKKNIKASPGEGITTEKMVYGEGLANDKINNIRGQLYRHFDAAGIKTNIQYDFKGNLSKSSLQLCKDYKNDINWDVSPLLDPEIFNSSSVFDALNRPVTITAPDQSVFIRSYNQAGLLAKVDVRLKGVATATPFVKQVSYDVRGRQDSILFGNNSKTNYQYHPKTLLVTQILTTGKNGTDVLQKLNYTYDPAGNITSVKDEAQQISYFNNSVVDSSNAYTYDALYRLVEATGREHIGQSMPASHTDVSRINQPLRGDGAALRKYRQNYQYDQAGNILKIIHAAGTDGWNRVYDYAPGNNRLKSHTVNTSTETFTYDAGGNTSRLAHLQEMAWNFNGELQMAGLGGGGKVYYTYASGQRMRKVIERQDGTKEQRLTLGGFEIYRKLSSAGIIQEQTETLHLEGVALIETKTIKAGAAANERLVRYQYKNSLGSVSLELDENASIISYEEYYPYGSTSYQAVNPSIKAAAKRYRYTGMERDEETGLEYHSARYYLPWLGRWLSADPIGIEGGLNLYEYAASDPVNKTDTSGHNPSEEVDKAAKNGLIDINSRKEFERQTQFRVDHGSTEFTDTWTEDDNIKYNDPGTTDKEQQGMYDAKWKEFIDKKYAAYHDDKAAQWQKSTYRMNNAANIGKVIGGATAVIVGAPALYLGGTAALGAIEGSATLNSAATAVYANRLAFFGAGLAYGVLAPPGAPNLPGPADDVGRAARGSATASKASKVASAAEGFVYGAPKANSGPPRVCTINCGFVSTAAQSKLLTSTMVAEITGEVEGGVTVPMLGSMWQKMGFGSGNSFKFFSGVQAERFLESFPRGTQFILSYLRTDHFSGHVVSGGVGRFGVYFRDRQSWVQFIGSIFRGLERGIKDVDVFIKDR